MTILLSTNEAAAMLGVSRKTLFKLCSQRKVTFYDLPGGFRFAPEALERYVESCKVPGAVEGAEETGEEQ